MLSAPSLTKLSAVAKSVPETATLNVQLAWLPDGSVAVQLTVVTPNWKAEPEGGKQTKEAPGQLSVTVGEKVTTAEGWPIAAVTLMFAGQLIVGGIGSVTVKVVEQVALLLLASLTVTTIVVVPVPTIVPGAGFCVTVNKPAGVQLSEASTPLVTFGTTA